MLIERKTLYDSRVHSHNISQHCTIHYAPPEKQAKETCIIGGESIFQIMQFKELYKIVQFNEFDQIVQFSFVKLFKLHNLEKFTKL